VVFVLNKRWKATVAVFPISYSRAEVPQGSIQQPGWLQMRRVYQVIATLWMESNPFTVGS